MTSMELFDILGSTRDIYIVRVQKIRAGEVPAKAAGTPRRRLLLIAAIVALTALLVGCAVVYALRLQDMAFGEEIREYYDGSSQTVTLLSIQGVEGTPGYQATKEWYEWLENYDTDLSVYHSEEAFSEDFGEAYWEYNLYSREMKNKLDEICAKYGLELLGKMYDDPNTEAACKALQIPGIFRPGVNVESNWRNFCYYANGSFRLEDYVTLEGMDTHIVTFRCHRKDAFSDLYSSIGPEGTYEEWTYTTSYGVDVLMVLSEGGVRRNLKIYADRAEHVFLLTIMEFEDMPLPDKAGMEAYAEAFDFSIQPQRVSTEDLKATQERRAEADRQFAAGRKKHYYNGFRISPDGVWYPPEGYSDSIESYIPYIIEHAEPERQYYAMLDLNEDGIEELLWGTADGKRFEVAVMGDGEVTLHFGDLCEGNVLLNAVSGTTYCRDGIIVEEECESYEYSTLSDMIVTLYYLPEADQWIEVRPGQEDSVITEAKAKYIMGQYPDIKLDMKPFSEYPFQ